MFKKLQKLDMVTQVIHKYSRLLLKLTTVIVRAGITNVPIFLIVGAGGGGGVA